VLPGEPQRSILFYTSGYESRHGNDHSGAW
jgi:hypothetical protein